MPKTDVNEVNVSVVELLKVALEGRPFKHHTAVEGDDGYEVQKTVINFVETPEEAGEKIQNSVEIQNRIPDE